MSETAGNLLCEGHLVLPLRARDRCRYSGWRRTDPRKGRRTLEWRLGTCAGACQISNDLSRLHMTNVTLGLSPLGHVVRCRTLLRTPLAVLVRGRILAAGDLLASGTRLRLAVRDPASVGRHDPRPQAASEMAKSRWGGSVSPQPARVDSSWASALRRPDGPNISGAIATSVFSRWMPNAPGQGWCPAAPNGMISSSPGGPARGRA